MNGISTNGRDDANHFHDNLALSKGKVLTECGTAAKG